MDHKILLAVFASVIGIIFTIPYVRDIFKGRTKPHSYTWLIWVITQGIATAGVFKGGGGWGGYNLAIATIINAGIFFLSIKYGTKNVTLHDKIALVGALLAIGVWQILKNPLLAVILVSFIDVVGYFPSFRKTFQEPWSETLSSWIGFTTANLFAILALDQYNSLTLSYLISITGANAIMAFICIFRRPIIPKPENS